MLQAFISYSAYVYGKECLNHFIDNQYLEDLLKQIRNITEEYKFVNKTNQITINEVSRNIRALKPATSTLIDYSKISKDFWFLLDPPSAVLAEAILKPALFTALGVPIAKALQLVYEPGSTLWDFYFPKGYFNVDNPAWIGRDEDVKT